MRINYKSFIEDINHRTEYVPQTRHRYTDLRAHVSRTLCTDANIQHVASLARVWWLVVDNVCMFYTSSGTYVRVRVCIRKKEKKKKEKQQQNSVACIIMCLYKAHALFTTMIVKCKQTSSSKCLVYASYYCWILSSIVMNWDIEHFFDNSQSYPLCYK